MFYTNLSTSLSLEVAVLLVTGNNKFPIFRRSTASTGDDRIVTAGSRVPLIAVARMCCSTVMCGVGWVRCAILIVDLHLHLYDKVTDAIHLVPPVERRLSFGNDDRFADS